MNYVRFRRCIKKLSPELYDIIGTPTFGEVVIQHGYKQHNSYYSIYNIPISSNMVRIDILEFIRYNKELIEFRLL